MGQGLTFTGLVKSGGRCGKGKLWKKAILELAM